MEKRTRSVLAAWSTACLLLAMIIFVAARFAPMSWSVLPTEDLTSPLQKSLRRRWSIPEGSKKIRDGEWFWRNETHGATIIVRSSKRDASSVRSLDGCEYIAYPRFDSLEYRVLVPEKDANKSLFVGAASATRAASDQWAEFVPASCALRYGGSTIVPDSYDPHEHDATNVVGFADLSDVAPDAVAVTILWRRCEPGGGCGEPNEFDIVFDPYRHSMSLTIEDSSYHFPSMALHEFGHPYGLDDKYRAIDRTSVMYGYASYTDVRVIDPISAGCVADRCVSVDRPEGTSCAHRCAWTFA